ncbi:hypothetical protein BKA70DRAFT_1451522 [Coprinopsis sp. MPI-PUGE-AT-0042]|nr:hypothetical protein BKA70DRAFT_1451522 [Coprinopsis sp. MPI-PUGE-AT-0042]
MTSPTLECLACGKVYTSLRFLNEHERKGCATSKWALSKILETSKLLWEARKRRRLEAPTQEPLVRSGTGCDLSTARAFPRPSDTIASTSSPSSNRDIAISVIATHKSSGPSGASQKVGEDGPNGWPRRAIKKPACFVDEPPVPLAPLPGRAQNAERAEQYQAIMELMNASEPAESSLPKKNLRWTITGPNTFGFTRSYYCYDDSLPTHDADAVASLVDVDCHERPLAMPSLGPFSNLSSFELGEWYWTTGGHLSMKSFEDLLAVLTKTEFSITDIAQTNWRQAFHDLAANKHESSAQEQWIEDDGW